MEEDTSHHEEAEAVRESIQPDSSLSRSDKVHSGSTIADPRSVEEADGRTYNGYRQGKYFIPNDLTEQDRLNTQHRLWLHMLKDKLTAAPLPPDKPITVLDIGTGTGIWAIQFAEKHPASTVVGTDLSLIQPTNLPQNCQFFREDSEEEPWLFEQPFDYIHFRSVCTCFHDPKGMVERAFKHLNPGGYVEYQDLCFECVGVDEASQKFEDTEPTSTHNFFKRCVAGAAAFGRDVNVAKKYKGWMVEAGFVDVVERQLLCPMNPWPSDPKGKELGLLSQKDGLETTKSGRKLILASGMAEDEVDRYLEHVRRNIRNTSIHSYVLCYVVYGRKPLGNEYTKSK